MHVVAADRDDIDDVEQDRGEQRSRRDRDPAVGPREMRVRDRRHHEHGREPQPVRRDEVVEVGPTLAQVQPARILRQRRVRDEPTRSTPCGRSRRQRVPRRSRRGRMRRGAGAWHEPRDEHAQHHQRQLGPDEGRETEHRATRDARALPDLLGARRQSSAPTRKTRARATRVPSRDRRSRNPRRRRPRETRSRPTGITMPSASRCCILAVCPPITNAPTAAARPAKNAIHSIRTNAGRIPRARSPGPGSTASWSRPRCARPR